MMPDKMQKKEKSNIEVLNIKDFHHLFEKEKRRYDPSLFITGTPTKAKRKKPVDINLYKRIVLEYLKIFFYDFYMNKPTSYFPLGGFLKKVLYKKWGRKMKHGSHGGNFCLSEGAIGLFWFMRPTQKMFYMVRLKKLTGSSNRLPKMEKQFCENYDKNLLPIFNTEYKRGRKNKTLYLCTQA